MGSLDVACCRQGHWPLPVTPAPPLGTIASATLRSPHAAAVAAEGPRHWSAYRLLLSGGLRGPREPPASPSSQRVPLSAVVGWGAGGCHHQQGGSGPECRPHGAPPGCQAFLSGAFPQVGQACGFGQKAQCRCWDTHRQMPALCFVLFLSSCWTPRWPVPVQSAHPEPAAGLAHAARGLGEAG